MSVSIINLGQRRLVIADPKMAEVIDLAKRASKTTSPVFLCGESGSGKELIARYIHNESNRGKGPFVTINCAAVPDGLMESELFGHERGAFTGAVAQHLGKFERATNGTLLLDEVSEMSIHLQAKLLRVLQEGELDRLGGRDIVPINCRVISTTNRDPKESISQSLFREDLFYRLNVIKRTKLSHLTLAKIRGADIVKFRDERLMVAAANTVKNELNTTFTYAACNIC